MKIDPHWKQQIELLTETFMNQPALEIRTLDRYVFPKKGGIYAFTLINNDDVCVYVGKSIDLRRRVFDTHLNGKKGRSSLRDALLSNKVTRNIPAVTTEDDLDDYIEQHFKLRFMIIEDITQRGCAEDYLNALLKPIYSVSLS